MEIVRYDKVSDLPPEWDELAPDCFRKKAFLEHAELHNPSRQRYYVSMHEKQPTALAIVYTLKLNLFTFSKIPSPVSINIIGVPCSVSVAGLSGENAAIRQLIGYIFQHEKGLTLALNLMQEMVNDRDISGPTLPTHIIRNHFNSLQHYQENLRYPYRRRLKKIENLSTGIEIKDIPLQLFDRQYYQLYKQVWKRSEGKLELLTMDFFRNLPESFRLTGFSIGKQLLGWVITVNTNNHFFFFMGGMDYHLNTQHMTYQQMLYYCVKAGIETGQAFIELGQTAAIPKMRFGAEAVPLFMVVHHRSKIIRYIFRKFRRYFVFSKVAPECRVFRES
jgi:hypothetical protein